MSKVIMIILIVCSMIGAIDKLLGNKLGYGSQFEAGIREMGNFALSMLGIFCLSPIIARVLSPVLVPFSNLIHVDPSVFMGSILATDMGGYTASLDLANSPEMVKLSGLILASMLGTTISFIIPVATGMVTGRDFEFFSKGCLCGIVTVPIGVFVGGVMIGVPMATLLINLIPIIVISFLIAVSLLKFPDGTIKMFIYLGRGIAWLNIFGLIISILNFMLGLNILKGMLPFEEGAVVIAKIAIILSGAYTLIAFLSKLLRYNLEKISEKLEINEESIMGIFTSLVNAVPMLAIFNKMDWKGQILNAAFSVSGAFLLGGQLAFVSTVAEDVVTPFMVSKIIAGATAIMVGKLFIKIEEK